MERLNYEDVQVDPEVVNRYERAMQRQEQMPAPPPVDHPIVQMAQRMLEPLAVGPMGPEGPAYPSEQLNRTPAQQDNLIASNRQRAQSARDVYLQQAQSGSVGPMGIAAPPDAQFNTGPGLDIGALIRGITRAAQSGETQLPEGSYFGPIPGGAINALTHGTRPDLNLASGPGSPGNYGLGAFPDNAPVFDFPVLGGVLRQAKYAGAEGSPITDLGPIPFATPELTATEQTVGAVAGKVVGKGIDLASSATRPGTVAAAGKDAERYVAQTGKTRSLVLDTQTGKTEPTIYNGVDHASQAESAAAKLNAETGTAPDAGIAVPNEAGLRAALGQLPTAVETAVRKQARLTPNMTPADMVATPTLQGQLMQALAKAKLPASDENLTTLAQQLLEQEKARPTVGNRNAALLRDALVPTPPGNPIDFGSDIPKPVNVPASAEQLAANSGTQTAEQMAQNDILSRAIAEKQAGPKLVATSPDASSIPLAPVGRNPAKALALGLLDVVTDIPRSLYLVGHLPLLRQGLPMMADAFVRGSPSEIPLAFGRTLASYVASDAKAVAMTDQFRGVLTDAGAPYSAVRKLVSDFHGPLSAREDYTLNSVLANVPVLKQLNRGFPTMMNSLRVGMALDRANMVEAAGQKVNWTEISDQVAHLSGKGDLPGTPGGAFQTVLSRALFGSKLLTAPWQVATDTIKSAAGIGADVLSKKPLNPNDIAQVRAVASYVLTGAAIMQIAQKSGLDTETNTDSRDWGRIVLSDGSRVDLWGAYGPDARLVMQALTWLNDTQLGIGTPLRPQKYGANNAVDMLEQYLRGKLGPGLPVAAANTLTGKTGAGQPFSLKDEAAKLGQDPLGYLAANGPRPLAVEEAQKGGGGVLGAIKAGLVEAGAGVVDTPRHINYDGLGAAEGDPNYRSGSILDTYGRMVDASKGSSSPWHGGDPIMPAPPTTIGTGAHQIQLDPASAQAFVRAVGEERDRTLGPLVNSFEFQNASVGEQQKQFDAARAKADKIATERYLANDVITATDPKIIQAEAVDGFVKQTTNKDRAYWVALLDRAGKLTLDVVAAIDGLKEVVPGDRQPTTVEEYRKYAPLVHEYLSHVPYGSDKTPIGTPADWAAVAKAKDQQNVLRDQMIRSGVNPSLADIQAKQQTLQTMQNVAQRSLFLNGASLVNQQRKQLAQKYGSNLTRFVSDQYAPQESEGQYQNPYGQ